MAIVEGTNNGDWIDEADGVTDGADTIYGYDGGDTISGRGGNDLIYGGNGADFLFGSGGDDIIFSGNGADYISGGSGMDRVSYTDSDEGVTVNLLIGQGFGGTAEGDEYDLIEDVAGSQYNDTLIGNDGNNYLWGGGGNDVLKGGGAADILYGGSGDNLLIGGAGGDDLFGGVSGVDTASYEDSPEGVWVLLYANEAAFGDAEGDELYHIENLTGSGYADTLAGDDGWNELRGLAGNDSLKGFGGGDTLYGGTGADTLEGMDGDDTLFGQNGQDWLNGGAGDDDLYGGNGADTFHWWQTNETGATRATADAIYDFNRAQGDVIDLSDIDANVYAGGNQGFTFIGTAAFSGTPGEIRYYHFLGNTYIEMQTGNSTDVEGVIALVGTYDPQASWFEL
jgi:Ca2+-binding RTX toxin-like protein